MADLSPYLDRVDNPISSVPFPVHRSGDISARSLPEQEPDQDFCDNVLSIMVEFNPDLEMAPTTRQQGYGKKDEKMEIEVDARPESPVDMDQKSNSMYGHFEEVQLVRQGLHQRHIQMIALAGTIGTGLFLGTGRAVVCSGQLLVPSL